jgi:hypothetical protein
MNIHTAKGWRIIIDMEDIIESAHPIKWKAVGVLFFAE